MKFKSLLLLTTFFCTSSVSAYQTQHGKIKGYLPYAEPEREVFFFNLDTTVKKGCNTTNRYAIDSSHKNFKSVVSAVMSAFHSNTPIRAYFVESCDIYPNSFDSAYVCVGDIPC